MQSYGEEIDPTAFCQHWVNWHLFHFPLSQRGTQNGSPSPKKLTVNSCSQNVSAQSNLATTCCYSTLFIVSHACVLFSEIKMQYICSPGGVAAEGSGAAGVTPAGAAAAG